MKTRWIGIAGAVMVVTALGLGALGPRLFPTAFGNTGGMMNGQMMNSHMNGAMPNGQMMNDQMMNDQMNGAMPNGQMMNGGMMGGGMMDEMMSGEVGGDLSQPFDLRFLDQMIMHHEGAVMSTQHMIASSARPELRDLAQRIITGQQREIDQMRAWRSAWYPNAAALVPMAEQMGGGMMGGSVDMDRMYLQMMIPHHEAAISMARQALTEAEHPEIKTLAERIITTQQAEIDEMEGYLKE